MILDPVLGLNGLAIGGINNVIDGLRISLFLAISSHYGRK